MISRFLQEQKRYSKDKLKKILECSEQEIVEIIRKLKELGIVKVVKASDYENEEFNEEEIDCVSIRIEEERYYYKFTFVGIISILGKIIKCYPKYLNEKCEPKKELKQILKVLEKSHINNQVIRELDDIDEDKEFNLLAAYLFLINDYYENGIYTNFEDIIETNGNGEIIWDRTINETFILINNNRPYYTELKTRKNIDNENDYFKRLHECVLDKAFKELKDADLLELFEITEIELSDEKIDDFGSTEYILYAIEQELKVQFNSRKQLVLKILYTYISNKGTLEENNSISLYGTNSFHVVWEKICAEVFNNKLNERINNSILKDMIPKPYWSVSEKNAKSTLIPDIISIEGNGEDCKFIIIDAKYYKPTLEKGQDPSYQPGIESVAKQYLYQLAYVPFIKENNIKYVANCFVMPTAEKGIIDKGYVSFDIFQNINKDIEMQNIQVKMLSAEMMYDYYLSDKKIDIRQLNLFKE